MNATAAISIFLATTLCLSGCTKKTVTPNQAAALKISAAGESCTKTADCDGTLRCVGKTCVANAPQTMTAATKVAPPAVKQAPDGATLPPKATSTSETQSSQTSLPSEAPPVRRKDSSKAIRSAREHNRLGLKSRQHGDNTAARMHYLNALHAAPSYAPARYNLACEYALEGRHSAALTELENLLKQGGFTARRFVAQALVDEDFASIVKDSRFIAVQDKIALKKKRRVLAQVCLQRWRHNSLLHPTKGFVTFANYYDGYEGCHITSKELVHQETDKNRGRKSLLSHLGQVCDIWKAKNDDSPDDDLFRYRRPPDADDDPWNVDPRLTQSKSNLVCATQAFGGCNGDIYEVCFARSEGYWYVAVLLSYPVQGCESLTRPAIRAVMRDARRLFSTP